MYMTSNLGNGKLKIIVMVDNMNYVYVSPNYRDTKVYMKL